MMLAMSFSTYLLVLWCVIAGFGIVAATAVLIWAVRSGQFRDQRRVAGLPLESYIPTDEQLAQERPDSAGGGVADGQNDVKEQRPCST
jgi:cbb3-type cytochrome oxidase maturation protein